MFEINQNGGTPNRREREDHPHGSQDPYAKGIERLFTLEQSGMPTGQAKELAALELLQEISGVPFTAINGQSARVSKVANHMLAHPEDGILFLMGKIVAHSALQWVSKPDAKMCRDIRAQALASFEKSLKDAEGFITRDPILAELLNERPPLDKAALRYAVPIQLKGHPLEHVVVDTGTPILRLLDVVKNKDAIVATLEAIDHLCAKLRNVVNEHGLITFAEALSMGQISKHPATLLNELNLSIGESLPLEVSFFSSTSVLNLFKASMMVTGSRELHGLAKLLTENMPDSRTQVLHVRHEDLAHLADLHLSRPKTIQFLRDWISPHTTALERKESFFWLLEHHFSETFLTALARHRLETKDRVTLLRALRQDDGLLDQLSQSADSPLKMRILATIIRAGDTTFLSARARNEALACATAQPHFGTELVEAWLRYASAGDITKATYVKRLWALSPFSQQDGSKALSGIDTISEDALPNITTGLTPKALIKQLEKTLATSRGQSEKPISYQRGIDPVALEVKRLTELGQQDTGDALARACATDLIYRRGIRVILENCPETHLSSALTIALSEVGHRNLVKLSGYPLLRDKLGKLFEIDPSRACHIIEDEKLTENWEQAKGMLLQTDSGGRTSPPPPSNADRPSTAIEPRAQDRSLVFGQWRGVKKVLIVGGEYTGIPAETITSAVPHAEISILDSKSDYANPHLLDGHFDLYVCVTRSLPHSLDRQAKIARQRSHGRWHNFNMLSSGLLAKELKFGFGILEED